MPTAVTDTRLLSPILPALFRLPTIVTWNRLEGRPRAREFSRSLRAEVRDALWMLARQWQLGEFRGEDAGSAVLAKVNVDVTRLTRIAIKGGEAVAFDEQPPLEARVERESVPLDALTRVELGQRWIDLLQHESASQASIDFFRARFPFDPVPAPTIADVDLYSNRRAWQFRAAAAGRAIDGGALVELLVTGGGSAADITDGGGATPPVGDRTAIEAAQGHLLDSYRRFFTQPRDNEDSAWIPERLEYQIACSAPEGGGDQSVFVAEEYAQGHLDWYAFDRDTRDDAALQDKPGETVDDAVRSATTLSFLPTDIDFGGMPSPRWWELEDRRTGLGDVSAETTDLARMLLAEFTLLFSNDWMVIPFELPVGAVARVDGLVVVDSFGTRQVVRPAGRGAEQDWQRWSMFNVSALDGTGAADHRLFLPPVVGKLAEGEPIEEVRVLRDEMANMVWGVEARIPDDLAGGRGGHEAAIDKVQLLYDLAPPAPPAPPPVDTDAPVRYVAGTTVPENWIPFIPVHVPGSNREIQLRRAAMPRLIEGLPVENITPRGDVLRPPDVSPYHLHEEEVLREGVIVTRSFQRTRGPDGRTFLWLGRRKRVGRDARASGLRFDQIDNR